ncbi:uncharacterized protein LOC114540966 [Dendronephthya gigantea]|uniref:uncharacterized protein LOC114540966 n=1 Tax=Dendronephthya gigantea TaxID=151771 RepID=UPI00106AD240|nr:uncharacterized protein LOC114540966 [Dendronephthya gigantea]
MIGNCRKSFGTNVAIRMSEAKQYEENQYASRCDCKSSCSTKRKGNRGCPCKGNNSLCSSECKCGTSAKPCKNREIVENPDRERDDRSRPAARTRAKSSGGAQGFRLSHNPMESEESQREKEHKDVKDFIDTLDESLVRKLAIRGLRRGIGSMDYIHSLLLMEDDLDEAGDESQFWHGTSTQDPEAQDQPNKPPTQDPEHFGTNKPDWCNCGRCQPMPQEVENKCCKLKKCITLSSRFTKLCLDPDVLELCIRNTGDIRNDREDNSTRAFRKAAYRQFILARHGHLGRGNRRVCPSCVVLKIRERFPSITGIYMGFREH